MTSYDEIMRHANEWASSAIETHKEQVQDGFDNPTLPFSLQSSVTYHSLCRLNELGLKVAVYKTGEISLETPTQFPRLGRTALKVPTTSTVFDSYLALKRPAEVAA